jgi:hypothetical protein
MGIKDSCKQNIFHQIFKKIIGTNVIIILFFLKTKVLQIEREQKARRVGENKTLKMYIYHLT